MSDIGCNLTVVVDSGLLGKEVNLGTTSESGGVIL